MTDDLSRAIARMKEAGLEISTAADALFAASLDHTRYSFLPDAVVFARKDSDVGTLLKIASEFGVSVTPRGAGTGCSGGAIPVEGGVVLDLSALDFIEIDPVARVAHVGAGAITAQVDKAANKYGLFYAPDPSSHKFSTIGGNIAHNAGGLRVAKYGTTRDNLMALSAYLANGDRLVCGLPLKKFSAGSNLRDLFVGSEGTLGVVAEAWLRLLPMPEARRVALALFDGDAESFRAVTAVLRSGLQPSILEFMDAETVACVAKREPSLGLAAGKSALLAEFDGTPSDAEESAKKFVSLFGAAARFAATEAEAEILWKVRRAASPAMYELGDSKVGQDIVLPFGRLSEFFDFFKKLGRDLNLPSPVFGHAADGNYHIHFMYNAAEAGARSRALNGMDISMKKAVALGGAVSGEHGIGFLKSKYIPLQYSESEIAAMRKIKTALDPKNILNPGKIYEPRDISNLEPLRGVRLPWD